MKHIGGYHNRNLGAQAREGYNGTEQIIGGHIVRGYGGGGGGGGLLGGIATIGLAIMTDGASLAEDVGMAAADTALAVDTIDAVDTVATIADTTAAVDTIDATANVLDTVNSVSDIPVDIPTPDVPTPDLPTPDVPTPDIPAPDGGLPPVNEGPMGPPAPEGPMGPPEPMGPPTPEAPTYNSNGYPDPSQQPYDPNGMPDATPPDPSKLPSGLSKITSNVAQSFAPTATASQTPASGTANQSALDSVTPNVVLKSKCKFLCGQANFLTNKGSGYKGGLEKLQQMPSATPSSTNPIDMYAMQNQMNRMDQAPTSSDLEYAKGGMAHLAGGAQPDPTDTDITQIVKNAFCQKNRIPKFMCDKPELLAYQNANQNHGLSPLKHIYSSIHGGYAKGGLPEKYHAAAPKGHNPEFITGVTGYYACGGGTGQSDDIPAMLHDGDYVMDAETVSALGDGSSKAGKHVLDGFRTQIPHKAEGGSNPVPAKIADGEYVFPAAFVTSLGGGDNKRGAEILDGLRTKLRAHKRGAPLDKIPPKARDPIDYIKKAKA